jgi:hypothetical protein
MSASRDPDQILHAWLEEGPTVLPAPTVRAIEVATRATAQRRPALRPPWRTELMPFPSKLLGVAAVLAIVFIGGALLLRPSTDQPSVGGQPSASAISSAPPSAATSPMPSPTLTSFTSPLYGYSIEHPDTWVPAAASEPWRSGPAPKPFEPMVDRFLSAPSGGSVLVWLMAQPVPSGTTDEAWMSDYAQREATADRPCRATPSEWAARTIGGAAGRFVSVMCPTPHGEAVVVIDGVGYAINGDLVHVETVLESFQAP